MLPEAVAPVRQVILKLHSRCNLACSYCYVYAHVDQSWRRQPFTMSPAIMDRVAYRIAEHARRHALDVVTVILHGGEPLLAGAEAVEAAVTGVRAAVPGGTRVDARVQTNGLLLDDAMLEVLRRNEIRVGVSLDGDRTANDRERRFAHGGSSYAGVADALDRLRQPRFRHLFSGLLCTVDVRNDPLAVYRGLLAFEPPRIDFLLPHGNWSAPPPQRVPGAPETPYADWLIAIFDAWYGAPRRETQVRLFDSILLLLLGGRGSTESVGLEPSDLVVVETDGSFEQGDALKTAGAGMAATGLHVTRHSFDDVLAHAAIQSRQAGLGALAEQCRSCEIVSVCGGGLYAHRFRAGHGFTNPTVYCPDQFKLIQHIRRRLEKDVQRLADKPASAPYGWTADQFRRLGAGYGDAASLAVLRSAESSKRRILLRAVADRGAVSAAWHRDRLDRAWDLLTAALRHRNPAADATVCHPFVDAWSQSCLRRLTGAPADPDEADEADLGYLAGLAVAAAVRRGRSFRLEVTAREGQLWLPTLGLAYGLGAGSVTVDHDGERLTLHGSDATVKLSSPYDREDENWLVHHRITADSPAGSLTVTVEDLDPYRACFGLPVAPRMAPADRDRLRRQFVEAWLHIGTHHREHAAAMRAGLRSIVPLLAPRLGSQSAASQTAFGAIAVSPTTDAAELALLMIHEAQHMKLGAIFDVVDLYNPDDTGRHHAPWRADPRPVGALFQGAYAHLGVADFWRVRRHQLTGADRDRATFEFAYWLEQTRRATRTLAGSDGLTTAGARFVAHMAVTLDGWRESDLGAAASTGVVDGVDSVVDALAVEWRLTNTRPTSGDADRLAAAFRGGGPAPAVAPPVSVTGTPGGPPRLVGLAGRLRTRLREPADHPRRPAPATDVADRAYLAGDFAGAVASYTSLLRRRMSDHQAWIGLALALTGAGREPAATTLIKRPDLIRSVYAIVRDDRRAPSPEALAHWLAERA